MKNPITGKEMTLCQETRTAKYRGESFTYMAHYYRCEESGERFTTTSSDTEDMEQVYRQYRQRHNMPSPIEIRSIRMKYGISASRMSRILGLGANQYRLYESGEMPSLSNARLIQLVAIEENFKSLSELYR